MITVNYLSGREAPKPPELCSEQDPPGRDCSRLLETHCGCCLFTLIILIVGHIALQDFVIFAGRQLCSSFHISLKPRGDSQNCQTQRNTKELYGNSSLMKQRLFNIYERVLRHATMECHYTWVQNGCIISSEMSLGCGDMY